MVRHSSARDKADNRSKRIQMTGEMPAGDTATIAVLLLGCDPALDFLQRSLRGLKF